VKERPESGCQSVEVIPLAGGLTPNGQRRGTFQGTTGTLVIHPSLYNATPQFLLRFSTHTKLSSYYHPLMPSKQVTDNDNAVYTTSNGAPVARPYAAEKIGIHGPLLLQGPYRRP
jgi:hypothetical protein